MVYGLKVARPTLQFPCLCLCPLPKPHLHIRFDVHLFKLPQGQHCRLNLIKVVDYTRRVFSDKEFMLCVDTVECGPVGRFHALFVTVSVPESAQPLCYLITCIYYLNKRDNCHVVLTTAGIDTAPPSLQVRVEAMTSD